MDLSFGDRIQFARGFVEQDDRRLVNELSARYGQPLSLAAGEESLFLGDDAVVPMGMHPMSS